MSKTLAFYKFSKGAKKDLTALNNRYTYSGIIRIVRELRGTDKHSPTLYKDNLVITVKEKVIIGVSLNHLKQLPRNILFNCDICFDSHHIQVADTCSFCDGKNCDECQEGFVYNKIACPNCTSKNIIRSNNDEWSDSVKHKQQQRHGNGRRVPQKTTRRGRSKISRRN